MTGKELYKLIKPEVGVNGKYSHNLAKWVKGKKDWPIHAVFSKFNFIDGSIIEYDHTKTQTGNIIICAGEPKKGWAHGRRLSSILCGERGVFSESYAFQPSFIIVPLPDNWWDSYIIFGKCFIDPEHKMYGHERWGLSDDATERTCLWCGHTQYKHTEMIPRSYWRNEP